MNQLENAQHDKDEFNIPTEYDNLIDKIPDDISLSKLKDREDQVEKLRKIKKSRNRLENQIPLTHRATNNNDDLLSTND